MSDTRTSFVLEDSVTQGFSPLPAGWYNVEIDEVETRQVKSGKNAGKEMYNYKLKVTDGDFSGRKLFTNSCLWPEAIFTQYNIQVATGLHEKGEKNFTIASEDDLIGKELKVRVALKDKFFKDDVPDEDRVDEDGNPIQDNEVNAYRALASATPAAKGKAKAKAGGFSL